MKVKIQRCTHPKCGVKMTRLYTRVNGKFVPVGWLCPECGISQIQTSLTTLP